MAYTYTDLTIKMKIDPGWLADQGTIYVGLQPTHGTTVEVEATSADPVTGVITCTLTQAQSAKLFGRVWIQANGFLNGARWASEAVPVTIRKNTIERVIANA